MKKFIAIFAVLLLAAPAMAADWTFYGSQRMATFWVQEDFGDLTRADGEDDDGGLVWEFQSNSRLGFRAKADKVSGHIELGLKGTDGGDVDVGTRRAYGTWKFADAASLKVGKDYSPVTRFLSGQVFGAAAFGTYDDGLLGTGNFYGKRPGYLGLTIGGFDLALITNALVNTVGPANSDPDLNLPKVEASWLLKFGSFDIRPFGGVQYFTIDEANSILTDSVDVISYVVGLDSMLNIGAFYVGGQVAYGQNWNNANWASSVFGTAAASSASLDGTDDTNDAISWSAMLVAGLNFTPTLKFEVGGGYRSDDPDISGSDEDEIWTIYGQAVITLAPGVFLVPEVGYYDLMDNAAGVDQGYKWYAGAKWQIDF
jgi:hypothetical protein